MICVGTVSGICAWENLRRRVRTVEHFPGRVLREVMLGQSVPMREN